MQIVDAKRRKEEVVKLKDVKTEDGKEISVMTDVKVPKGTRRNRVLSSLPAGTVLTHKFRDQKMMKVRVIEPVGPDGKGGVLRDVTGVDARAFTRG